MYFPYFLWGNTIMNAINNRNNASYYAIVSYIILILLLFILKPSTIYDHKNQRFKEFGTGESKTLLPLPVVAIILAILTYIIFSQCFGKTKKTQQITQMSVPMNASMPMQSGGAYYNNPHHYPYQFVPIYLNQYGQPINPIQQNYAYYPQHLHDVHNMHNTYGDNFNE
jgi:uncharacterized integral membrane protein